MFGFAGKCAGAVLTDSTCSISAASLTGRLDLCTMEGVASGNRNLPDVFAGAETGGNRSQRGSCACALHWLDAELFCPCDNGCRAPCNRHLLLTVVVHCAVTCTLLLLQSCRLACAHQTETVTPTASAT
jgi:hypothetical protein